MTEPQAAGGLGPDPAEILLQAMSMPADQRRTYIAMRCGTDDRLCNEVLSLLTHLEGDEEFLEKPPTILAGSGGVGSQGTLPTGVDTVAVFEPGSRVGQYVIQRTLGEGGMGVVYLAQQDSPRRLVALKVIRAGYLSAEMLRRFEYEAQILGRLQHSGIAQIYEAGVAPLPGGGAVPFFAMEYVQGVTLTEYARSHKLAPAECCNLMIKVCDAVNHAHQRGIIHRDLKPGNILIDAQGQPRILDFGIARATDSDMQVTTIQTNVGQLIGTLPYMSPEQVLADPNLLDTRSDVYALGVMLYELLAGRPPLDLTRKMLHEAVRVIREEEPTKLSSIHRTLRGDLDTIVGKSLEKDRTRRYQSASEFASDLQRFLHHEPVIARPPSLGYQFTKFARRNRAVVTAAALVMVSLVGGVIGTTWGMFRAAENAELAEQRADSEEAAKERAVAEAAKYAKVLEFLETMLGSVNPYVADNTKDLKVRTVLDDAARGLAEGSLADQPEVQATVQHTLGMSYRALGLLSDAEGLLRASLTTRRAILPAKSPDVADTVDELGEALREQGRFAEAEPLARESLAIRREIFGPDHKSIARSLNNLALTLKQAGGDADEIEALYRESLAMRRRLFGNVHVDILNSLNNFAQFRIQTRADRDGARVLLEEAVAIGRELDADGSLPLALCLDNLGRIEMQAGNMEQAGVYYDEMLAMERNVLAPDHFLLGQALNNVAIFKRRVGDYSTSEAYYRESIAIREKNFGPKGMPTIDGKANLAVLLRDMRRLEEAEVLGQEAYEARLAELGPDHWLTLNELNGLATGKYLQLKFDEAIAIYRDVVERYAKIDGAESNNAIISQYNLGNALSAAGQFDEAEEIYRRVLEMRTRLTGPEHPDTARSQESLAALLALTGRIEEAETLSRQALATRKAKLPAGHRELLASLVTLGNILTLSGSEKAAEAEPMLREAVGGISAAYPPGHWAPGDAKSVLGACLAALGRFDEAEPLLLDGYADLSADVYCPPQRKRTARERLADLYDTLGRPNEAARWREMNEQ